jgi:peroxiredoxin
VELQHRADDVTQTGTALFAISYDSVEVLSGFSARYGITYPLLSDKDSQVIRALGLYNEHLVEQARFYGREARPDQFGVPYPGVFHLDDRGIIVAKQFEQSYRVRPAPPLLLELISHQKESHPAIIERAALEGVAITVWADSPSYRPYEKHEVHVDLQLADGIHVYGTPIPDGYVALDARIAPCEGLDAQPVQLPPAHPFQVAGLDESFFAYHGEVSAVIPFNIVPYRERATLSITVRCQACTETTCYPPQEKTMDLTISGVDLIRD